MDPNIMADVNDELNSVSSDCSFVILGSGPPSTCANSGSFHQILSDSSMRSMRTVETALECLSHNPADVERQSDIQMQLDQLVKDNLLLKETLNQSNMAMKNQFTTLSMWYDEVVKTHEVHRQKFLESQEEILKLQTENVKLKKMVDEKVEMCSGCSGNCSAVVVNVNDEGVESLQKKLESARETSKSVSKSNEELSLRNKELEKRLNDMTQEKMTLEKKLEEAMKENDQRRKNAETEKDKYSKCQSSFDSKNESERASCTSSYISDVSVVNKLSKGLEENLGGNQMNDEIALLKRKPTEQQDILQDDRIEKEKLNIQYEELLKDKEKLQNVLKTCKTSIEQLREQVKALTVQVKMKEDLLENRTRELEKVKKEMDKFVLDCEEVAILRAQVELYQNDFNEERNAREKAVGEKERMAEEVRLLRRMLNDTGKSTETKDGRMSPSSTEIGTMEVRNTHFCLLCFKQFRTQPELESHIEVCLNYNAFT